MFYKNSHEDHLDLKPGKAATTEITPLVQRPSKTQKKLDLHRLKAFAERVVDLPAGKLALLEMPDYLRAAIEEARRIPSRGARRRQVLTIGRMMEDVDAEALRLDLSSVDHIAGAANTVADSEEIPDPANTASELAAELIRGDDETIFALGDMYERHDLQTLRQVVRQAKKTIEGTEPEDQAKFNAATKTIDLCLARLNSKM